MLSAAAIQRAVRSGRRGKDPGGARRFDRQTRRKRERAEGKLGWRKANQVTGRHSAQGLVESLKYHRSFPSQLALRHLLCSPLSASCCHFFFFAQFCLPALVPGPKGVRSTNGSNPRQTLFYLTPPAWAALCKILPSRPSSPLSPSHARSFLFLSSQSVPDHF